MSRFQQIGVFLVLVACAVQLGFDGEWWLMVAAASSSFGVLVDGGPK